MFRLLSSGPPGDLKQSESSNSSPLRGVYRQTPSEKEIYEESNTTPAALRSLLRVFVISSYAQTTGSISGEVRVKNRPLSTMPR